ncbi:MAG: hypothetical protein HYR51_16115 [Candidatus Rokubacteria bacterium]|nr:hypothetical protein [Candidatus Rokubacteria bacterium]
MDVLSPVRAAPTPFRALAPRRGTLAGARIGVLDNSKPNADTLLGRVAALLVERHGAASVTRWQKPGASRPAAMIEEVVAGADLVLTGSAD